MIKITNTLTKNKEDFIPIDKENVKMYSCGITVSGTCHIGHGLQALIFDIIRNYLEFCGFNVEYARNYTDVDDKIIANANKLGISPVKFAKDNIEQIEKEMKRFEVGLPTKTLYATNYINEIINFIQKLITKGVAYKSKNHDVYFSVDKFPEYGKLSNRKLEDAISGVRIETNEDKRNPLDFALWKACKPNEIYWESPFGNGRPGWHIECSAMNYYTFGDCIDIHGGGRDLIFPHHENEIAQTESITEKQFAKYWIHNGLIKINGQKMSKSLNNFITLSDILDKYNPETIKLALLQTNYKNDINITDDLFPTANTHIIEFYKIIKEINKIDITFTDFNQTIIDEFKFAMDDDFNTALAIANLFGYFKTLEKKLLDNDNSVARDFKTIKYCYNIMGLFKHLPEEIIKFDIPEKIANLANLRWVAKQNKDYKKADEIRLELKNLGYIINDKLNSFEIEKI